jgi:hypothetical protein
MTAAVDDSSVAEFLRVAPLFVHDTLDNLDKPQIMTLALACIVTSNTAAARSPPRKETRLPLCGQPWGPNYYLGDQGLMKWGDKFTLLSKKTGGPMRQGDRGWVSSTSIKAVRCTSFNHLHLSALQTSLRLSAAPIYSEA